MFDNGRRFVLGGWFRVAAVKALAGELLKLGDLPLKPFFVLVLFELKTASIDFILDNGQFLRCSNGLFRLGLLFVEPLALETKLQRDLFEVVIARLG